MKTMKTIRHRLPCRLPCRLVVLLVGLFLVVPAIAEDGRGSLTVEVLGLGATKGTVRYALFDSAEAYELDGEPLRKGEAEITDEKTCGFVLDALWPGEYGLRLYHDKNDNDALDRGRLGVPKEPYGFSNDARGRFGPPKWEAIRFSFGEDGQKLEIRVE